MRLWEMGNDSSPRNLVAGSVGYFNLCYMESKEMKLLKLTGKGGELVAIPADKIEVIVGLTMTKDGMVSNEVEIIVGAYFIHPKETLEEIITLMESAQ